MTPSLPEPDPEIKVGDPVHYVSSGRDGRKLFLFSGVVKTVTEDEIKVDCPAKLTTHARLDLGWSGKTWEYEMGMQPGMIRPGLAEAPRKRGVKRGR